LGQTVQAFLRCSKQPMKISRRSLLNSASALGAYLSVAQQDKLHSTADPFRIGCLNVGTYSHLSDIWAPLMNRRPNGRDMPITGIGITNCWDIERDKGAAFAKTYGCELVKNFDDMVGKVDGIISGGYYNHPWNHIIHQPYLEAGLPNLINRPFSNSLLKARKMIEVAKKHGATILCPSAYEYTDATARAKAWVANKKILCYDATNSFDEYPTQVSMGST